MKKETPPWKGAGVVVYTHNPLTQDIEILVGIETKYLSDYTKEILPLQIWNPSPTIAKLVPRQEEDHMFSHFESQAIFLSAQRGEYVTFDKPILKDKGWCVNFRVRPHAPDVANYGIPKGTRDPKDISDKDTANRELEEETGIYLPIPREATPFTQDRGYNFYMLKTDKTEAEEQIRLHQQQHYHELHDVRFIPLTDVLKENVNGLSRKVIKDFKVFIGTKLEDTQ
jgi:hypothetical protein